MKLTRPLRKCMKETLKKCIPNKYFMRRTTFRIPYNHVKFDSDPELWELTIPVAKKSQVITVELSKITRHNFPEID